MPPWFAQTWRRLGRHLRATGDHVGYTLSGVDPVEHEKLRQRVRLNNEKQARHQRILDVWRERLTGGAVLNLIDDGRSGLFFNHAEQRDVHHYYVLIPEVREWCDETLGSMVYEIPLHSTLVIGGIWFPDPLDAVAFKIRWY